MEDDGKLLVRENSIAAFVQVTSDVVTLRSQIRRGVRQVNGFFRRNVCPVAVRIVLGLNSLLEHFEQLADVLRQVFKSLQKLEMGR